MSKEIIDRAEALGFIGIGFSTPQKPLYFDKFLSWVSARKNADMSWMKRHVELRENPGLLLRDCRTIISLAFPYSSHQPGTPDGLNVSRYSQPDQEDYHHRLRTICSELVCILKDIYKGCKARVCVDSVPILERSLAYASGIGFIGKNNMLIIPDYGSYFYLAEIMTTAAINVSSIEPMKNLCGSCTRCLDACPAGALEKPFYLNASKCLSYLTIENKVHVNKEDGTKMGDCFFGCDRCQEVCPFNAQGKSRDIMLPSTEEFLRMNRESFSVRFGNTALARAGIEKIKANIHAIKD